MLQDNGFSSTEELVVYHEYDASRLGCSFENRFVIKTEGSSYVHNEYEFLDLLMQTAHGPAGREWELVRQQLIEELEDTPDSDMPCPCCVDEMTIQLPGRLEETYYFDITAGYLALEQFLPGGSLYEDAPESEDGGLRETLR